MNDPDASVVSQISSGREAERANSHDHLALVANNEATSADAINFVLRTLNLREIEGSGGIKHRESVIHLHADGPTGCAMQSDVS